MNTNTTLKDTVVTAWDKAHDTFVVSPSAHDLVHIANTVNPSLPKDDDTADRLYDALCDGTSLADAYDIVYG